MRFFALAATLVAAVAAHSSADEVCSLVTVTVTETAAHTPSAPGSMLATGPAPYPTTAGASSALPVAGTGMPYPSVPAGTGVPYPSVPAAGTGISAPYPSVPAAGTGVASSSGGIVSPSGTGVTSASSPEFTGAASSLKMGGGVVVGVLGVVGLLL